MVGGGAVTEEIAPGFRCPTLAHATGPLRPSVVRDMRLGARGVEFVAPDPRLVALSPDGRAWPSRPTSARTVEAIRAFSDADAARYPRFLRRARAARRVPARAPRDDAALARRRRRLASCGSC